MSVENEVIYDLRLKDGLTGGVNSANTAVNRLESSLGSVKGLLEGIGIGLAAFKLGEFIHDANEEWDKMEFAMSQVDAALKSTKGAAGLTFDQLITDSEAAAHSIKFTQSEILGMQSILLTFPGITKDTFGQTSTIIEDMSTRLGQDLKSSAIQVGKALQALQDPERGITALRRVGVNFNKEQEEVIKTMVETNQVAKAQALILQELQVEFGGSAAAAADADKSFRLDKTMEESRVQMGQLVDEIKEDLMPMLLSIAEGFKNLVKWIKDNKDMLIALAKAVGIAMVAAKVFTMVLIPLGEGLGLVATEATEAAAAEGEVAAGATAALGPLGLLAAAIGAVVFAYQSWAQEEEERAQRAKQFNIDVNNQENTALDTIVSGLEKKGLSHIEAIKKAKDLELKSLNDSYDALTQKINEAKDIQEKAGLKDQRQILLKQMDAVGSYSGNLVPAKKATTTGMPATPLIRDESKSKATASRAVTINVTIKEQIHSLNFNTTNIKESMHKIKEAVTNVMTSAVNDFQIVAGNS